LGRAGVDPAGHRSLGAGRDFDGVWPGAAARQVGGRAVGDGEFTRVKPVTDSLKVAVKIIGVSLVGEGEPARLHVGATVSEVTLHVLEAAVLVLPARSWTVLALTRQRDRSPGPWA